MRFLILFITLILSCTQRTVYDLSLKDLEGKEVALNRFKGKPTVLYVWTGTCVGHTEDLRTISLIYRSGKVRGNLISVAVLMGHEGANKVLDKEKIEKNFPLYADERGKIAEVVKLTFLPATLLIAPDGRVIENHPGLSEKLISLVLSHN